MLESEGNLARAQSAIDQDFAVIGRHQGAVSGTSAAEQSQTEHDRYLATAFQFSQIKFTRRDKILPAATPELAFSFPNNQAIEICGSH